MQVRKSTSRREFLKLGAVGAASAILLAACGGGQAPPAAPAATSAPAAADAPKPTTAAAQPTTAPAATKPAAAPVATKPAAAAANTEIAFFTTQANAADVKTYETIASTFMGKNPNIKVKVTAEATPTGYDQKLLTWITAGTLPDIVQTSDNYAVPFKKAKITRDMIPFAKATKFPYEDFEPTFLNLGMVDGELHMLPKQGDVIIPYVNLRMAKEGGFELPKFDPVKEPDRWTWDDFMTACRHMSIDASGKRGDQAGFDKTNVVTFGATFPADAWYIYVPLVLGEGGKFLADDGSRTLINSPEGIEAFRKLTDPMKAGYWAPLTLIQTMGNSAGNVFAAGKAAFSPMQRLWSSMLRDQLKDDFDVVHFPKGPARRVAGMGTFGFALTTASKHPDDAWKYLEFMYSEEGMKIIAGAYGAVPAMKRFYNASFWRDLPGPPYNNAVFVDAFAYGTTPPRLPFYSTGPFRQAVTDGIVGITLGKTTPEQVVANIEKVLNEFIQQQNKS